MAWVTLQCACGNIQQRARCGASIHSPVQPDRKLKCTDACLIAQRNIKLAEALGLNPAEKAAPTKYENSTLAYYGTNKRFAEEVESTLIDFIRSSRHGLILPPANRAQRQFTHELADAFKLVSESVDAEPRRSVSIRRKQESKVPHPLLSEAHRTYRAESGHGSALGQLRRSNPSSAAPSSEDGLAIARENRFPLNAVLLEGVFGHDEPSLRAILQPLLRTAGTLQLRWVGDEDVLVSSDNPSRLVASRTELRSLLYRVDMPAGRVASAILLVHADARGNIVRVETTNPAPASATVGNTGSAATGSSSASHGRMATGTTGAWAAVAASNPASLAAKSPAPSAWGGASPALAQAPSSAPLSLHPRLQNGVSSSASASASATASATTSPRRQASPMLTSPHVQPSLPFIDNSSIPDEWDDSVDAL